MKKICIYIFFFFGGGGGGGLGVCGGGLVNVSEQMFKMALDCAKLF